MTHASTTTVNSSRGTASRPTFVRVRIVEGARNLPLHELVTHSRHAPNGELWVHCASGYRASIAASLLARARFSVVLVNDEFDRAEAAGMTIVTSS